MPYEADNRLRVRLIIASALILVSMLAAGFTLYERFAAASAAKIANAHVWRTVLCDLKSQAQKNPHLSAHDKMQASLFYNELLVHDVHTLPCLPEVSP